MPMMSGWGWAWTFPLWGMGMMVLAGWVLSTRVMNRHPWDSSKRPDSDPLDQARERYAQGLISKSEFERLVEDLLHTEHHDIQDTGTFRNQRGGGRAWGPSDSAGRGRRGPHGRC